MWQRPLFFLLHAALLTLRLYDSTPATTARPLKGALSQPPPPTLADTRRACQQFFTKFDAVLGRVLIGSKHFEDDYWPRRQLC